MRHRGRDILRGELESRGFSCDKKNQHCFCKHCGVRGFGIGTETPIGKMYGINLGCLTDVSDDELSRLPITYVDGRNDRWQSAPEFFAVGPALHASRAA